MNLKKFLLSFSVLLIFSWIFIAGFMALIDAVINSNLEGIFLITSLLPSIVLMILSSWAMNLRFKDETLKCKSITAAILFILSMSISFVSRQKDKLAEIVTQTKVQI